MNIVLIETSGNQRYIFSTNKLRENVGASELTFQIGTEVVKKYVDEINKIKADALKTVITTSGKAILLADDETTAKKIICEITKHALREMPGLTVHGAICEVEDLSDADSLHQAVGEVHRRLEEVRYQMPSNQERFQRLPFTSECATSNLPAEKIRKFEPQPRAYSNVVITKAEHKKAGYERIQGVLKGFDLIEPQDIENLDWLAVIHADGNGVGETFLKFNEKANPTDGNDYIEKYFKFSSALDECTLAATCFALDKFKTSFLKNQEEMAQRRRKALTDDEKKLPIVPLILGGDDLTIICKGEYAIKFTKDFLQEFEKQANKHKDINQISKLGICAGIAIIKPHYPFHQAYVLAEELLKSAKKTKEISISLSALDYHILYDSSGVKLEDIREKTPFVARPYVVTPLNEAKSYAAGDANKEKWIENHHFDELKSRIEVMSKKGKDGKKQLPASQMHVLREGLYVADTTKTAQQEVDARAKLINHRYDTFNKLYTDKQKETLFFDALLFDKRDGESETKLTHFLDALDAVEFWK